MFRWKCQELTRTILAIANPIWNISAHLILFYKFNSMDFILIWITWLVSSTWTSNYTNPRTIFSHTFFVGYSAQICINFNCKNWIVVIRWIAYSYWCSVTFTIDLCMAARLSGSKVDAVEELDAASSEDGFISATLTKSKRWLLSHSQHLNFLTILLLASVSLLFPHFSWLYICI